MSRSTAAQKAQLEGLHRKVEAEMLRADKAEARERQIAVDRDAWKRKAEEAQAALCSVMGAAL